MKYSVILLVLVMNAQAFAGTVSYTLTGTIADIRIDDVTQASLGPLNLDTPFRVDFTLDKSANNIFPPQAIYPQSLTVFNYFVSVGGLTLQSPDAPPGSASVQIIDGPAPTEPDSIYVFTGSPILSNNWTTNTNANAQVAFHDPTGQFLSSDLLAELPILNLQDLIVDPAQFFISFSTKSTPVVLAFPGGSATAVEGIVIRFELDSLALVSEPSTFVLAALGLISLVVWRRRKQAR